MDTTANTPTYLDMLRYGHGMLVTPRHDLHITFNVKRNAYPIYYLPKPMAADEGTWYDLPIARALGTCPLRFQICTINSSANLPNPRIADLAIDVDPSSKTSGQSSLGFEPVRTVVVARVDDGQVHISYLDALFGYVDEKLGELRDAKGKEEKGEEVDRAELVGRLVNKEAFMAFWEEIKVRPGKADPAAFEGMEFPEAREWGKAVGVMASASK